ncbi:MAG TPA: hypothetical protein VMS40_14110, partial [Vicinamibacterales bacterium]|nr:hypothetical protein [Vicinamibacterales bacterium]
ALSPGEMPATQAALSEWCVGKAKALDQELDDLREHMLIATSNGWKLSGLQASIRRAEKRIAYYGKVKDAVDAGYLIVPNFPVTVLAVRVDRAQQPQETSDSHWSSFSAKPELLPSGEGRYVDELVVKEDHSYTVKDDVGTKKIQHYISGAYEEPDFPFRAVKPAVLAAAERAMALRIFDQIGMVRNGSPGRDPIIVGQLLDPRGNDRRTTFFIAWWLNTADL